MVTLVRDPAVLVSVFPRPAWPVPAAAVGLYLPMSDLRKEKGLDPRPPAEPEVPPGAPQTWIRTWIPPAGGKRRKASSDQRRRWRLPLVLVWSGFADLACQLAVLGSLMMMF